MENHTKPIYNKFFHSKIYKLQANDGYFYIGSTIQNLNSRLNDHRCTSNSEKKQT